MQGKPFVSYRSTHAATPHTRRSNNGNSTGAHEDRDVQYEGVQDDRIYGGTGWQKEVAGIEDALTTTRESAHGALGADTTADELHATPRPSSRSQNVTHLYEAKQAIKKVGDFETALRHIEELKRTTQSHSVHQTATCLLQACEIATGRTRSRTIFLPKDAPTRIILVEWINALMQGGKKVEAARLLIAYMNSGGSTMEKARFARNLGVELRQVETEQKAEDVAHKATPTLERLATLFRCNTPKERKNAITDEAVVEALICWRQYGKILTVELFHAVRNLEQTADPNERKKQFSSIGTLLEQEDQEKIRRTRAGR